MAYDIFISYRRKGAGAGVAGELQSKLENMGYKVFLDVDEIGSGQFPEQIEKAISECKDFILVLSPGTLDRCVVEEDWVRREILHAQKQNKNILGVGLPGFIMPEAEALPDPLKPMTTIQVFSWTHEYRTASFEKIAENLVSSKLKKQKKRQKLIVLAPVVVALIIAGIVLLPKKQAVDLVEVPKSMEPVSISGNPQLSFNSHVNNVKDLTKNLPDTIEFSNNVLNIVSNREPFERLMEGLAECDSAWMLKNKYGNSIVDLYGIDDRRNALMSIKKSYLNTIKADIRMLSDMGARADLYSQDMEIVGILDKHEYDSLQEVIKQRLTE